MQAARAEGRNEPLRRRQSRKNCIYGVDGAHVIRYGGDEPKTKIPRGCHFRERIMLFYLYVAVISIYCSIGHRRLDSSSCCSDGCSFRLLIMRGGTPFRPSRRIRARVVVSSPRFGRLVGRRSFPDRSSGNHITRRPRTSLLHFTPRSRRRRDPT